MATSDDLQWEGLNAFAPWMGLETPPNPIKGLTGNVNRVVITCYFSRAVKIRFLNLLLCTYMFIVFSRNCNILG